MPPVVAIPRLVRPRLAAAAAAAVCAWMLAGGGLMGRAASGPAAGAGTGAEPGAVFDEAARLYAQGRAAEAAARYDALLAQGVVTPSVLFNQGNAWLQADQVGRAIASFRQARRLAPRDAEILEGLNRARARVGNGDAAARAPGPAAGWMTLLTANEWAAGALAGVWLWFGLLAARRSVPRIRESTRSLTWCLAALTLGTAVCAWRTGGRPGLGDAVVVVPEATVRFGPLEESQLAFRLPNGAEVRLSDRKGDWVQVRDGAGRAGWMPSAQVAVVP